MLSHLFKGVLRARISKPKTHLDHLFFTWRQCRQHLVRYLPEVRERYRFRRVQYRAVLDEIAQVRIFLFTDRRFERDRLLCDLQDLSHLGNRDLHPLCDLFARRFAAEFLNKQPRRADQFVDRFDHMHRDTDRPGLVRNSTRDRLTNPPRGVCREFVPASPLEFIDSLHQADVAFLDQVEELQAAVRVFLGDRDHEPEVRFDQLAFCLVRLKLAYADRLIASANFNGRQMIALFKISKYRLLLAELCLKLATLGPRRLLRDLVLQPLDRPVCLCDLAINLADRRY